MERNPNMKTVTLRKSNNSLRFTIPAEFVERLHLKVEEPCRCLIEENKLTVFFLPKQLPGEKPADQPIDIFYDPFAPKAAE
jgi:hypothetical protein